MVNRRLSKNEWRTYHHREIVGDLSEEITKIHALTRIVLDSNLAKIEPSTMFDYWGILGDIASSAKRLCQELNYNLPDN